VLISNTIWGRRLSWPKWLVTYQDGILCRNAHHLSTNWSQCTVILLQHYQTLWCCWKQVGSGTILTTSNVVMVFSKKVRQCKSQNLCHGAKITVVPEDIQCYFAPGFVTKYYHQHVCMSVCMPMSVCPHISKTLCPNFTKFSVHVELTVIVVGPHLMTMQYVMYFQFSTWNQVFRFSHNGANAAE